MVSSGVSSHPHSAVALQFFETAVRYDKFFNQEPQYIPDTLVGIAINYLVSWKQCLISCLV